MKRFLVLVLFAITLSSCSSKYYFMHGDVTAYNQDGTILEKWNDVVIEEGTISNYSGKSVDRTSHKSFGLNFIDPKTGEGVILSNATPYIIRYRTEEGEDEDSKVVQTKAKIAELQSLFYNNKKIIKDKSLNSEVRKTAKKENSRIYNEIIFLRKEIGWDF